MRLMLGIVLVTGMLAAAPVKLLYDVDNNGKLDPANQWTVDLVVEAGKSRGLEVIFDGVAWQRGLDLVKSGEADGIIGASYKEERATYAIYPMQEGKPDESKSLKAPAYHFYIKKGAPITWDGKRFEAPKGSVGAIASYAVIDNLKALGLNIVEGVNEIGNLRGVLHGALVASAELEHAADATLKRHAELEAGLQKLPIPVRKSAYYLIFSKPFYAARPKDAEAIWEAIGVLRETPKYKALRQQFE